RGQVPGSFQGGSGCDPELGAHLVGDNSGQSGLAETGWSRQEDVVEGSILGPGRLDRDPQAFLDPLLAGEIVQSLGSQARVELVLHRRAEQALLTHVEPARSPSALAAPG